MQKERVIMTNISTLNDVQKIIVLDYGSQYNQLIARRIREFGVFSELKSHKITADEVRAINPIGIILSWYLLRNATFDPQTRW